jgi:hypothetical protein
MSETEITPKKSMRGTAIAWGIILLLIAAGFWFFQSINLAAISSTAIVWNVVVIGAILIGIGIVGAIVRAVSTREHPPVG